MIERLTRVGDPFVGLVGDPGALAGHALEWRGVGLAVPILRGPAVRTLPGLFGLVEEVVHFPYACENWDDFREGFQDVMWAPTTPGIVLLFPEAAEVLADAPPGDLETLVSALLTVAHELAENLHDDAYLEVEQLPFHVVLGGRGDTDLDRWRAAGASPETLP